MVLFTLFIVPALRLFKLFEIIKDIYQFYICVVHTGFEVDCISEVSGSFPVVSHLFIGKAGIKGCNGIKKTSALCS